MRNEQRYNPANTSRQRGGVKITRKETKTYFLAKDLRTWFSITTTGLFLAFVNKVTIARMVANLR